MSDDPRNAADRVRHILQAMERSIVTARRRRLNHGQEPQQTEPPGPAGPAAPAAPEPQGRPEEQVPQRLRARPKRPSGVASNYEDPPYHSQAG